MEVGTSLCQESYSQLLNDSVSETVYVSEQRHVNRGNWNTLLCGSLRSSLTRSPFTAVSGSQDSIHWDLSLPYDSFEGRHSLTSVQGSASPY